MFTWLSQCSPTTNPCTCMPRMYIQHISVYINRGEWVSWSLYMPEHCSQVKQKQKRTHTPWAEVSRTLLSLIPRRYTERASLLPMAFSVQDDALKQTVGVCHLCCLFSVLFVTETKKTVYCIHCSERKTERFWAQLSKVNVCLDGINSVFSTFRKT